MTKTEKPPKVKDPGIKSYFFGKGYVDLKNTIVEAWQKNMESFNEQKSQGSFDLTGGVHLVAAVCILVYGSLITAFTTVLHVCVLALFFLLIYACFGLIWLIDRIYISVNKIKNACPNPDCQAAFLIPVYECPDCGALHRHLTPGTLGILKRRCTCGSRLPTTFMNGRGTLTAYCPECNCTISGNTASRQYAIPVIGGPSVGKTCFINMSVNKLVNEVAPAKSWDIGFISENDERAYNQAKLSIEKGIRPLKTEADSLTAFQMMLKLPKEKIGRRIYLYDIAGEMFFSSGDVQKNNAYNYADGFIFMIDPLSLDRYCMEMEDKINVNSYGVSSKSFDDILNIMLINLEKMFGLSAKDVLKLNMAVVINKMDIPGLEDKIGRPAVDGYMRDNPSCQSRLEAQNAVCKDFLEQYEAGNFVRSVDSKFKSVQYFTCSSLGHNNEGEPFDGYNVSEPLIWIISQVDKSVS